VRRSLKVVCQYALGGVGKRDVLLLTNTDNAQTLVDEDGVVGDVVAAPVGTAVLDLLAHADGGGPELLHIGVPVRLSVRVSCILCDDSGHDLLVAGEDTTHVGGVVGGRSLLEVKCSTGMGG
jgi:hypothetical protein